MAVGRFYTGLLVTKYGHIYSILSPLHLIENLMLRKSGLSCKRTISLSYKSFWNLILVSGGASANCYFFRNQFNSLCFGKSDSGPSQTTTLTLLNSENQINNYFFVLQKQSIIPGTPSKVALSWGRYTDICNGHSSNDKKLHQSICFSLI